MDLKVLNNNTKQFLFILTFIILQLSQSNTTLLAYELDVIAKECEPKRCGTGPSISYPFWLQDQQQPYCGYPTLNLTCQSSRPLIRVLTLEYYISNIDYDSNSVLFTPVEFTDGTSCPLYLFNYTVSVYPFTLSDSNRLLFFLLNCSAPLSHYDNYSCTKYGKLNYFGGVYDSTAKQNSDSSECKFVNVPVANYSGSNDSGDGFSKALSGGWLMNWDLPSCSECRSSGGICGYDNETSNFMCSCSDRGQKASCKHAKSERRTVMLGIILGSACLISLCICLSLLNISKFKKMEHVDVNVETYLKEHGLGAPKRYKYSEIKKITKSFRYKLGQGGFGSVFKGKLPNGCLVAVKILTETKGNREDFINEVASISRTSHINVVRLEGYCLERSKRALVYDYMPNGSLEKFIYADKNISEIFIGWNKLYEIANGVARGLEYLHRGCNTRIVHFDIKPHNILLDENFNPKISDFGLAKLCLKKESIISMVAARGTVGYIAPEVFSRNFGAVSTKSDVYSYGMMVLEMVGGRTNIDVTVENSSEIYFPHWIYDHLDLYFENKVSEFTIETEELVRKMIIVSLWCIQTVPANRPSMNKVVDMLEGKISDIEKPPKV